MRAPTGFISLAGSTYFIPACLQKVHLAQKRMKCEVTSPVLHLNKPKAPQETEQIQHEGGAEEPDQQEVDGSWT